MSTIRSVVSAGSVTLLGALLAFASGSPPPTPGRPAAPTPGMPLAAAPGEGPPTVQGSADAYDIWLYSRTEGALRRLTETTGPGRESTAAAMSADGSRIVFYSDDDFLGEGIADGTDEIWLYDVGAGELVRVTRASDASRDSTDPAISGDGSKVVFSSDSDFHGEGIPSGQYEIWLLHVASGDLRRLTRASVPGGRSVQPAISSDGTTVAFASDADPDRDSSFNIWVAEIDTGEARQITRGTDGNSLRPSLNADGTRLSFDSDADLLTEGRPRGLREVWLYDAPTETLTRLTDGGDPSRSSEESSISGDGTRVAFYSDADLLGTGRPDSVDEVWLYDATSATLRRLTSLWVPERDAGSNPVLHPDAGNVRITADGSAVVFASDGDLLDEGLAPGFPHVWIHDLRTDELRRIDTSAGSGSGVTINADASRMALFRSGLDTIRRLRVTASAGPPRPETLTAEAIDRDLDALQAELEQRWAYLEANGVDYVAAIDEIRAWATGEVDYDAYGIEVQKLVSRFIDGHAGVGGFRYPDGFLPFFLESTGDRFVAIQADRSNFVAPGFPYVRSIDGVPIDEWIDAAADFSPQGSPQYVRWRGLRMMSRVQFLRGVMGLPQTDVLGVELVSEDGADTRLVGLTVAAAPAGAGIWPRGARSGLIDGDVGYLRIESMTPDAAVEIDQWMAQFRDTRGLIVDVRGNGGGLRHPLRALYPYLVGDDAPPRVINAAKYRLHPDHADDHLGGSRFLYRESWTGWTPAERRAIASFRSSFTPEWTPPADKFSDWHYLVLARHDNPAAYVYGKPVVVLLDEKCFSATDIFLAGLKGVPGVTLLGSASGGGSARAQGAQLPESGLSLRLASMASFQRSGLLYDGNGIEPDVVVEPLPEYFLAGGTDNILEAALARLNGR